MEFYPLDTGCFGTEPTPLRSRLSVVQLASPGDPQSSLARAGDTSHSVSVSQRTNHQSTIGYSNPPNNYRYLTNPNAQLQQYQRIIARQNLNKSRPPVPKFDAQTTSQPRHRNSAPGSTQGSFPRAPYLRRVLTDTKVADMSVFDHIDFQGGYHADASLDFLDTSFGSNDFLDSPQQAHPATVSPTELFTDEMIMSAPASMAFPNLGTPVSDFMDSPGFTSSGLNTTPMLEGALDSELDMTRLETLPSLFPEAQYEHFESPAIVANNSFGSLSELTQASPMVRQKSSPGRPPIVHDRKASLSAGITKANQKSRKELPDIVIESEDDKETAKRKKNTAAARKSRQRKQETMGAMAAEIARLRAIVESLGGDPDHDYEDA
ncbi:General control protein [Knufia fluminis]|uniref:General control protein n=1 Tax=Knufia fluminis TaxID=191047 RepID=A0AAN8EI00_9EURO|nr:General control protein [Knufia fluminis]